MSCFPGSGLIRVSGGGLSLERKGDLNGRISADR